MELRVAYKIEEIKIKGNETKVTITSNETGEVFEGVSRCNKDDIFNYENGVKIALNRAINNMISATLEDLNKELGNNYEAYIVNIVNNNNICKSYDDPRNEKEFQDNNNEELSDEELTYDYCNNDDDDKEIPNDEWDRWDDNCEDDEE